MKQFASLDLNGQWDFFYSPQKFIASLSQLPEGKVFSGKMAVPGYWDDHYELFDEEDFFGLTARFNPDYRKPHFPMGRTLTPHAASSFLIGTGFYRKRFTVDEKFACAELFVGPAMWECSVYCNGHFAGHTACYSCSSRFVLDDFLKAGEENEIILAVCNFHDDGGAYHRVDKSHDGIPFGARPGQHRGLAAQGYQSERGGINGGVYLKLSPAALLADHFISCDNGNTPHFHVESRGEAGELCWKISRGGETIDSGRTAISGTVEFTASALAESWSDKNPVLYDIELQLVCGGKVCDLARFKWGPAKLTVNGMALELNGIPTFFRGVTEHCYFPETTNPHYDREKYLRDLSVIRRAGFNFIRCHTWCPPEPFYQACDELGFLVQTELPSVWSFDDAERIIRQIRRHPSAVILCEGNEKIIDETAIIRLQKLVKLLHEMAPGMLFNPQEAMRGIEYEFTPGRELCLSPLHHDPERLDRVREFSDCFGSLGGEFSYEHDCFPGREVIEKKMAVYGRPCLDHEAGILGGYLDFSLEKRYEDTFIGTDLFIAARKHMLKHGVYANARKYYEKNTLFISSCRKQLIENIRSCRNMAGFDYLGGIDTHWHLIGYPCGIFNEFYEEKFGETIADVRRYCGESILLCTAGNRRNFTAGTIFSKDIEFVCYESTGIEAGTLTWRLESADHQLIRSGTVKCGQISCGKVCPVGTVEFVFPECSAGKAYTLFAEFAAAGKTWENRWDLWSFPGAEDCSFANVQICSALSPENISFMESGGCVLLTDNFPSGMFAESFRSHTSGRSLGHAGALLNPHPIWEKYPHKDFLDWQFFPMMTGAYSMLYDPEMPEFSPIFELIPSFKMVKHKSLLSEFTVGKGRLMICGFNLEAADAGAGYMRQILVEYLGSGKFVSAPQWNADDLRSRIADPDRFKRLDRAGKPVDAGGRPID